MQSCVAGDWNQWDVSDTVSGVSFNSEWDSHCQRSSEYTQWQWSWVYQHCIETCTKSYCMGRGMDQWLLTFLQLTVVDMCIYIGSGNEILQPVDSRIRTYCRQHSDQGLLCRINFKISSQNISVVCCTVDSRHLFNCPFFVLGVLMFGLDSSIYGILLDNWISSRAE